MDRRPPSLLRHLQLLEACAGSPQGFNQLRRLLAPAPASTLARALRTLAEVDLVREAGGRYELAPGANALALRLLGRPAADPAAQAAVDALAAETGESAAFFLRTGARMVLLAKREVPDGFHYIDVHAHRELIASVFGVALAAALPAAERKALLAEGLPTLPPGERALVPAQVRRAGQEGFLQREEGGGRWRLVAAVVRGGRAEGGVGISRFGAPAAARLPALRACALAAARRLGA
jgi:DNA-binding IclR family transcriptional regulator